MVVKAIMYKVYKLVLLHIELHSRQQTLEFDHITITILHLENIFRNMASVTTRNYLVHLRRNYKNYLVSVVILFLLRTFFYSDISVNSTRRRVLNEKEDSHANPNRLRKLHHHGKY